MTTPPNLYFDIDGVLRGSASPPDHVQALLRYALTHFPTSIYWLTTHCRQGYNHAYQALKDTLPTPLLDQAINLIQPTDFGALKTDALDFSTPFLWFDDNLFESERHLLAQHHAISSHFWMNPRDPHSAQLALQALQSLPEATLGPDLATTHLTIPTPPDDPTRTLDRFLLAQIWSYDRALREFQQGYKYGHYIWYILPQLQGLGHSANATYYGLQGLPEAIAYLQHPILSSRLLETYQTLLDTAGNPGHSITPPQALQHLLGPTDTQKLHSSATLFWYVAQLTHSDQSLPRALLRTFYGGQPDLNTLDLLDQPQNQTASA